MPGSSGEGKRQALEMMLELDLKHVLDVGPGIGTWRDLLFTFYPEATYHAIEIFEPYVERFGLRRKYTEVRIADASDPELTFKPWEFYDLAIFGDVIEHIERQRAIDMVWRIPWKHAIISLPLGEFPQGPSDGNEAEAHVATWYALDVEEAFHPVKSWFGRTIGVFLLERTML